MTGLGEAAPTAGLAPRLADLWPAGDASFAAAAADFIGAPHLELVSSGTAALRVAFSCLKRRSGRTEVVVPAYTCPLVVEAAAAEGLAVIACDLVREGLDLDLDHLRTLIGPRTLCVVATHYFGWLTDVDRVCDAVKATDPAVAIVEDAAQAFGGRWHGRSAGLAGDIGVLSFGVGKGVTLYSAGGLLARDPALMAELTGTIAHLSQPSAVAEALDAARLLGYHLFYNPLGLRVAYGAPRRRALRKGDDIAAAGDHLEGGVPVRGVGRWRQHAGTAALPRLRAHLDDARARFDLLAAELSGRGDLRVHVPQTGVEPTCLSMFVTFPPSAFERGALTALWRSRHGMSRMFARALGDYPSLQGMLRTSRTPNASDFAKRTLTLTTSTGLIRRPELVKSWLREALAPIGEEAGHAV